MNAVRILWYCADEQKCWKNDDDEEDKEIAAAENSRQF